MKYAITNSVWVLLILSLFACSSMTIQSNKYMSVQEPKKLYVPSEGKALVIFERENNVGYEYYNVSIWDVTNAKSPKYVALLANAMKSAYEVESGENYFMAVLSGKQAVIKANVSAGKTYYVMPAARSFTGLHLIPIKKGDSNDITPDGISISNQKALDWANKADTINSVHSHRAKGMAAWNALASEKKMEKTLELQDGR